MYKTFNWVKRLTIWVYVIGPRPHHIIPMFLDKYKYKCIQNPSFSSVFSPSHFYLHRNLPQDGWTRSHIRWNRLLAVRYPLGTQIGQAWQPFSSSSASVEIEHYVFIAGLSEILALLQNYFSPNLDYSPGCIRYPLIIVSRTQGNLETKVWHRNSTLSLHQVWYHPLHALGGPWVSCGAENLGRKY